MVKPVHTVTRTTRTGLRKRFGSAVAGVAVGALLLVSGCGTLFWNEGRAVKRARVLAQGAGTVVSVDAAAPSSARDGQLVHVQGEARSDETLRDDTFGIAVEALALHREVEMYQWVERSSSESRKKLGGSVEKVTTYEYHQEWRDSAVDEAAFEEPSGHANPPFPLAARSQRAQVVQLGKLQLADAFSGQINRSTLVPAGATEAELARRSLDRPVAAVDGVLYVGNDPQRPLVGDLRIRFSMVPPTEVSLVGLQRGGSVDRFTAGAGSIALLEYGSVPAASMFTAAQKRNRGTAWLLRLAGFLMLAFGFSLFLAPLAVVADVIPMLGRIVGAGVGFASFAVAAVVSLVVISLGWFAYRPMLSALLLGAALAVVVWLLRRSKKARSRREQRQAPAKLPPLPPVAT